ncbi:MAG: cupredoxin domain-containing protein [Chloroflexi bacterium]|nr:cupredoxin domain-containing protein [Chloroflexota bacterium]
MKRLIPVTLLVLLLALPSTGWAAPQSFEVEISDNNDSNGSAFNPSTITVTAGSTVTWRNTGSAPITVTSRDELFDSRTIEPGKSWSHTFDDPGVYRYFCVPRPWMKGTVVVVPDESPARNSSSSSSSAGSTNSTDGSTSANSTSSSTTTSVATAPGGATTPPLTPSPASLAPGSPTAPAPSVVP